MTYPITDWTLPWQFDEIRGHLRPGQEKALHDLACLTPENGVILEVGAFKGRSTCALAMSGRTVHTIDAFTGKTDNTNDLSAPSFLGEFFANLERVDCLANVIPHMGLSSRFWKTWAIPVDMLFIDGGHDDEIVSGDFEHFFPWLKKGGILAMHDVYSENCDSLSNGPNGVWCRNKHLLTDREIFVDNLAVGRKL